MTHSPSPVRPCLAPVSVFERVRAVVLSSRSSFRLQSLDDFDAAPCWAESAGGRTRGGEALMNYQSSPGTSMFQKRSILREMLAVFGW